MSIEVKVLADSVNPVGERLVTVLAKYPRVVHSELMTHRVFSRNAASSRAIPVEKVIESVMNNPYIPRAFGMKQKGMQPKKFLTPGDSGYTLAVNWWMESLDLAIEQARAGTDLGFHKQVVNRLLEPFQYITVVISSTEWDNFINLRTETDRDGNPMADIPIFDLATEINTKLHSREPDELDWGGWHIPFAGGDGWENLELNEQLLVSAARCARTSYAASHIADKRLTEFDKPLDSELSLSQQLVVNKHFSPFEHQAHAVDSVMDKSYGNFIGFRQQRWYLEKNRDI